MRRWANASYRGMSFWLERNSEDSFLFCCFVVFFAMVMFQGIVGPKGLRRCSPGVIKTELKLDERVVIDTTNSTTSVLDIFEMYC